MTYSIIGRDAEAGEIGAIVQSYYYGCAPRTLLLEAGVGVVVMQMVPDMLYGTQGMAAMASHKSPASTLEELTSADSARAFRQVAMMDSQGEAAAFTGEGCIPASGHRIGRDCCAQGAMVESEMVWEAMVDAFDSEQGRLSERLIAAMRAGEREGGDIRGKRAAAMIVVSISNQLSWVRQRPIDIRVDDDPEPLIQVKRHLALQRHMGAIELAFERGLAGDVEGAVKDFAQIAHVSPHDPDVTMRYAIMLAKAGDMIEARRQLMRMSNVHSGWARVPYRLVKGGLLPQNKDLLEGLDH